MLLYGAEVWGSRLQLKQVMMQVMAEMGRNEEVYRVLGESDENGRG